ncbi:PREDICTED: uncharacterized protein LOC105458762 [Wasmannia auropunctata]|uniref:uncharacterized protein LOC105458762 n=1 Tax=Wasmannia auropunctata TaxID=64793 RepID=UPI0005EEB6D4|nr:PREDICTED: uncharacterized protein LOC105458762 [Wasmannia auropunctata]
MAARQIDTSFKTRLALQLLEVLSSSSSSSDEDEFWNEKTRKIPKIENFVDVVHNLTDKEVSTANNSLDKKPLNDPKTEEIKEEYIYRDGYERASKRKANTLIANLTKDSSSEDEDGRRLCARRKKRTQSNDKSNNVECAENQYVHANHKKATSNMIVGHSLSDNNDMDIDNERDKYLCSKKRTDEKDEKVSSEYPRRIIPPNSKMRLSLARQRRGNTTSKPSPKTRKENKAVEQARNQKKDNTVTDEEIRRTLEEDWNDDEEEVTVEKDVKIQPLPLTKEIQLRLRGKRLFSKTAQETWEVTNKEESDEERNKKKKLKLCGQKEEESCRIENKNGSLVHQLLSDDEDKSSKMNQQFDVQNGNRSDNVPTSTNNVSCPICNKLFPHNKIEDHAANCEQFETNNEESGNNTNQLDCNICSNYKTNNGMEYEEHIQQCISNKNNERHSHGSEDTNTTSTSSFRHFKPISEQKDSEIDYLGQFSSNNKKNIHTGRKKKR